MLKSNAPALSQDKKNHTVVLPGSASTLIYGYTFHNPCLRHSWVETNQTPVVRIGVPDYNSLPIKNQDLITRWFRDPGAHWLHGHHHSQFHDPTRWISFLPPLQQGHKMQLTQTSREDYNLPITLQGVKNQVCEWRTVISSSLHFDANTTVCCCKSRKNIKRTTSKFYKTCIHGIRR